MENLNFTELILKSGFTNNDKDFNPKNNWYGVSRYDPYAFFFKEDKCVFMTINRTGVPYNPKYKDLWDTSNIRYIELSKGNSKDRMSPKREIIYQDWTGNIPSKELLENFLND